MLDIIDTVQYMHNELCNDKCTECEHMCRNDTELIEFIHSDIAKQLKVCDYFCVS